MLCTYVVLVIKDKEKIEKLYLTTITIMALYLFIIYYYHILYIFAILYA